LGRTEGPAQRPNPGPHGMADADSTGCTLGKPCWQPVATRSRVQPMVPNTCRTWPCREETASPRPARVSAYKSAEATSRRACAARGGCSSVSLSAVVRGLGCTVGCTHKPTVLQRDGGPTRSTSLTWADML